MDEVVEVEFIGGPLDGERHLFAERDVVAKLGTGELWVSSGQEDERTHRYTIARKRLRGVEYDYVGQLE
jgi:hypothetical protein